jgi:hypothetical protein
MEIRGIGAIPPGTEPAAGVRARLPLPSLPVTAQAVDTVASLLSEIAGADGAQLLAGLDRPLSPQTAARVEALLSDAVSAAASGDIGKALGHLATLAPLDPKRAENLPSDPRLQPIRAAVESLLTRLNSTAHLDAETRLGQARSVLHLLDNGRPEAAVLVATRLLEAGGYANAVRSSQISQQAIDLCRWAPATVQVPLPEVRIRAIGSRESFQVPAWLVKLWRSAPFVAILLGWAALGLAGGILIAIFRDDWPASTVSLGVEFWVIGLLTLVISAFYTRVRGRLF